MSPKSSAPVEDFTSMHQASESETENGNSEPMAQLARSFSLTRTYSTLSTNVSPFLVQGPLLDPKSPKFLPELWVKAMLHAFSQDPEKFPRHTAGVSWRNLNVHGFGDPTDYQKNVLNVAWRGPLSAFNWLANRKRKIRILNEFDGLVESGELLLVLGRPGRYGMNQSPPPMPFLTPVQRCLDPTQDHRWSYSWPPHGGLVRLQLSR